jgi:hypothetical protein
MIQLCYISTARPAVTPEVVDRILGASRTNNKRVGVTGILLFNGKRFLQLLEGEAEAVTATYRRIARDPRHYAIVKLSEREIEDREFDVWDMAYQRFADAEPAARMNAQVATLTRLASPNVKALFTSYAAM